MERQRQLDRFREMLVRRRDEIFEAHRQVEDDRRSLSEPDVEFEESAQKESIADTLAQVDEREKEEIVSIDQALAKMGSGEYGLCEICGRWIGERRLTAIPWTTLCTAHARQKQESGRVGMESPEDEGSSSSGLDGLSAVELGELIADEARRDEGVDLEELRIAVHDGQIHLEGFLPTEAQHQRLLEIIRDHLDLEDLVDEIVVNPMPWEREDRTPGVKGFEDVIAEIGAEETDVGQGPIASRKIGTSYVPPDTLVPEER